jgi:hypothetical protein
MKLLNCLSEHPASVGETYSRHWLHASVFAVRMLAGGLACLVHAFLPFLFVQTASKCIAQLHATMTARAHIHRSRSQVAHPGSSTIKTVRQPQ